VFTFIDILYDVFICCLATWDPRKSALHKSAGNSHLFGLFRFSSPMPVILVHVISRACCHFIVTVPYLALCQSQSKTVLTSNVDT